MTKPIPRDPMYRQRAFDADVIELCVRWYITYRLSYRDLVELMAERGIKVAHSTILRWVTRYVPEFPIESHRGSIRNAEMSAAHMSEASLASDAGVAPGAGQTALHPVH